MKNVNFPFNKYLELLFESEPPLLPFLISFLIFLLALFKENMFFYILTIHSSKLFNSDGSRCFWEIFFYLKE